MATVIGAGLQIDVVVAAQVAGRLVFYERRQFEAVVGASLATARLGDFTLRNGHDRTPLQFEPPPIPEVRPAVHTEKTSSTPPAVGLTAILQFFRSALRCSLPLPVTSQHKHLGV